MLRTILIDDEAHIRDMLRKLLAMHCPVVSVVGKVPGVQKGINEIMPFLFHLGWFISLFFQYLLILHENRSIREIIKQFTC